MSVFTKILRAGEGRALKELEKIVGVVNELEPEMERLSDEELAAKTVEFKDRLANGATLDDLMVESFAVVREAAKRVLGQRHYDVQIIGGGALHRGMVAEMRTGEGKTLVSTLPVYLNALEGRGVHVVTVNDYLASRDADWMGGVHRFLGLSVGLIQSGMSPAERRPAYAADITYGTNNEVGFDYLRDNMAMRAANMVQRGYHYAIVDEVDSILIDEARTPLIISGQVSGAADWYKTFAGLVHMMRRDDHYEVDEAKRQVLVNEEGVGLVERRLNVENLYDEVQVDLVHHLETALKAKELYELDVDYLIDEGQVKIVDEFTGRVMEGRRYSEGLHQAIEAKEGVAVKDESQTLATITIQNFFRLYEKLAGMTGTAETEAAELAQIYDLEVLVIPTNVPVARIDEGDLVYKTEEAKYRAVVDDVKERNAIGQPILLGTVSIEKSERVSNLLRRQGIEHEVLNAKQHFREAEIIAQAGRPGKVTVATNMAGRGVDIVLGGNSEARAKLELRRDELDPEDPTYPARLAELIERYEAEFKADRDKVKEVGGLYVIGTERHESRRIDNQLRGRSGRQGDPGESRFYLSVEDDLMRRFQGERVASLMTRLRMPDDIPIEHKMITNAVERAQKQVESQNFEIRKNVLKYDEVMNAQREVIYRWRSSILQGDSTSDLIAEWLDEVIEDTILESIGPNSSPGDWDWDELNTALGVYYSSKLSPERFDGRLDVDTLVEAALEDARAAYVDHAEELGAEVVPQVERSVMLTVIDNKWREQLSEMDYLRAGIGLRAMGQRDPLTEYQREAYEMFSDLVELVKREATRYLFHVQIAQPQTAPPARIEPNKTGPVRQVINRDDKVGRNEPCPCGSGLKYKRCHGAA
jgi:preprotein translocase subunit SecA